MQFRSLSVVALGTLFVVAACSKDGDNDITGTGTTATVGFVNATSNSNLSVANNGTVATGNGNLAFGGNSSCMVVNPNTNALTFTNAATGATVTGFTPTFSTGGHYTVVAYTDAAGNTQFATLNNSFTPASGSAGLRVFNAASGSGNVFVLGNGATLGTDASGVGFGSSGTFFSVPSGSQNITFNTGTGTATIANGGSMSFTPGTNYTLILGPASSGSTTLRTTLVGGC
ncbi:MAG TPA: DUF4397 domain-containing protein [Gemmatimonadaceae bacterium]|nr:DUF4397 domain-containing protein [Gemmatimonadaceae bacterium]